MILGIWVLDLWDSVFPFFPLFSFILGIGGWSYLLFHLCKPGIIRLDLGIFRIKIRNNPSFFRTNEIIEI